MGFLILVSIFLLFLYFAWQEQKAGNTQWAIVFIIAGFAFLIMAMVTR
ncbi:MAG: hypothetical protein NZ866_02295 [Patescibacteria group bacterium]|nr:hypothetical protein [Patescibacteria group bacterium]